MRNEHEALQYIPMSRIRKVPQVRSTAKMDELEEVMQSLERFGQLHPIRVCLDGESYKVVSGHLRFLAAQRLGWPTIACIIESRSNSTAETMMRQLAENLVRVDLSPVDTAKALTAIIQETGCSKLELGKLTGLKPSRISKLLPLLTLNESTQEKVANGTIPADTGYQLSRIDDPEKRAELVHRAESGDLTRDEASEAAKEGCPHVNGEATPVSRIKVILDDWSVSVAGPGLVMESFVEMLQRLLAKARHAKAKNVALNVFVRSLRKSAT